MPFEFSVFEKEAPLKIVDKIAEKLVISAKDIIQTGQLILVKHKRQNICKQSEFLLTNNFLYYVSKFKKSNESITLHTKAKISISWLRTHFYTKRSQESAEDEFFIEIQKGRKAVTLQCKLFSEYEAWVINLSRLTIQTNFFKKYKVDKLVGEGGSAKVYRIINNHNSTKYACKKFKKENIKSDLDYNALVNEIK